MYSQLRDSSLPYSRRNCFDSAANGIEKLSEIASGSWYLALLSQHKASQCHTVCVYSRHDGLVEVYSRADINLLL